MAHDNTDTRGRRSDDQWRRMILQYELKQLKREQEHLSTKSLERPLTTWESSRLKELADDMMMLLQKFTTIPSATVSELLH